jgi:hypothetical protein
VIEKGGSFQERWIALSIVGFEMYIFASCIVIDVFDNNRFLYGS